MTHYHAMGLPRSCVFCGEGFPENREPLVPSPLAEQGPLGGRMGRMVAYEHPSCRAARSES